MYKRGKKLFSSGLFTVNLNILKHTILLTGLCNWNIHINKPFHSVAIKNVNHLLGFPGSFCYYLDAAVSSLWKQTLTIQQK